MFTSAIESLARRTGNVDDPEHHPEPIGLSARLADVSDGALRELRRSWIIRSQKLDRRLTETRRRADRLAVTCVVLAIAAVMIGSSGASYLSGLSFVFGWLCGLLFILTAYLALRARWVGFEPPTTPDFLEGALDERVVRARMAAELFKSAEKKRIALIATARLTRRAELVALIAVVCTLGLLTGVASGTSAPPNQAAATLVPIATGEAAESPRPQLTPRSSPDVSPPFSFPSASPSSTASPTPTSTAPGSAATCRDVLADGDYTISCLLEILSVAPEDGVGYRRGLFRHWTDADGNGCRTRAEVLIRDAIVGPDVEPPCRIVGGTWLSPYDGLTLRSPREVDIDHVVPLAEAWRSGASAWTDGRREAYANDLAVPWALAAVSQSSNRSKADRDPAAWVPPSAEFLCQYLADWLGVKARWGLNIDDRERSAVISREDCSGVVVRVVISRDAPE